MKPNFSRLSTETARKVRSVSSRRWYLVGVVGKEESVAVRRQFARFCAVVTVSGEGRWERSWTFCHLFNEGRLKGGSERQKDCEKADDLLGELQ